MDRMVMDGTGMEPGAAPARGSAASGPQRPDAGGFGPTGDGDALHRPPVDTALGHVVEALVRAAPQEPPLRDPLPQQAGEAYRRARQQPLTSAAPTAAGPNPALVPRPPEGAALASGQPLSDPPATQRPRVLPAGGSGGGRLIGRG